MLTADAFGVLPPIAKLTPEQAMRMFLAGYTAKVAGTEVGVVEPQATFSACFGAPFLPQPPSVYAELLRERIKEHGASAWLVNTGWTGGPYGTGSRMPIAATRAIIRAALSGELDGGAHPHRPQLRLRGPVAGPGRGLRPARPPRHLGRRRGLRRRGEGPRDAHPGARGRDGGLGGPHPRRGTPHEKITVLSGAPRGRSLASPSRCGGREL